MRTLVGRNLPRSCSGKTRPSIFVKPRKPAFSRTSKENDQASSTLPLLFLACTVVAFLFLLPASRLLPASVSIRSYSSSIAAHHSFTAFRGSTSLKASVLARRLARSHPVGATSLPTSALLSTAAVFFYLCCIRMLFRNDFVYISSSVSLQSQALTGLRAYAAVTLVALIFPTLYPPSAMPLLLLPSLFRSGPLGLISRSRAANPTSGDNAQRRLLRDLRMCNRTEADYDRPMVRRLP